MMMFISTSLSLSFLLLWLRRINAAIILALICLALSVQHFLWEVYNPEYGFRMPWIQTKIPDTFRDQPLAATGSLRLIYDGLIA